MTNDIVDKRAPMASAPMKYNPDGSVDWGDMWDTFCVLASEGGPPHRGTMLHAPTDVDAESETYQAVVSEIVRGIREVGGLRAAAGEPGWVAVECHSPAMARWLYENIEQENVAARADGNMLFVPAGAQFTVKGEIKNVITAVAKTTHYWYEHLPPDVKRTLALQEQFSQVTRRLAGWLRR